jgi:S1-C subfamily serine protease
VRRLRLLVAPLAAAVAFAATATGPAAAATKPKPKPPLTQGVVLVTTNLFQSGNAAGTGIVLTKTGEVLTNNHVIRGATTITVTVPATKRQYPAEVVGYSVTDDVALLQLDDASGLKTVTRGNSSKLRIGDATTAVGNANGGGKLVITHGKITGLQRSILVSDDQGGASRLDGLIQTSAHLVPGDSGGPLLNAARRVIGIDTAGSTTFAVSRADGYAIPINRAMVIARLIEAGASSSTVHIGRTAFIGISVDGDLAVTSVVEGGPAATAGITEGAVITSFDGQPVDSLATLRSLLLPHHPGDSVAVGYTDPAGTPVTVTVVLGDGPPQ